jgi:hypothetical protein
LSFIQTHHPARSAGSPSPNVNQCGGKDGMRIRGIRSETRSERTTTHRDDGDSTELTILAAAAVVATHRLAIGIVRLLASDT